MLPFLAYGRISHSVASPPPGSAAERRKKTVVELACTRTSPSTSQVSDLAPDVSQIGLFSPSFSIISSS